MALELRLPAMPNSIDRVQDLVADLMVGSTDDLDRTRRMRFETALVEIFGNIVEHGVPTAGCAVTVHVRVHRADGELSAVITDDGAAVDLDFGAAEMPDCDAEQGRGLAMAHALATEVRYECDKVANRWIVRCT